MKLSDIIKYCNINYINVVSFLLAIGCSKPESVDDDVPIDVAALMFLNSLLIKAGLSKDSSLVLIQEFKQNFCKSSSVTIVDGSWVTTNDIDYFLSLDTLEKVDGLVFKPTTLFTAHLGGIYEKLETLNGCKG